MYRRPFGFVALVLAITLSACGAPATRSPWAPQRPLGTSIAPSSAAERGGAKPQRLADVSAPTGELTLQQAVRLALLHRPQLAGLSLRVREAEATALQAGLRPNPGLEFELEEFAGTGELAGADAAGVTLAVGQLIELGGKRSKRRRLGDLDAQLAGWDYEAARVGTIVSAAVAFTDLLAAQERVRLAGKDLKLAEALCEAVAGQVVAGKVSPVETTRANVELHTSMIRLERAARDLNTARHALAATWGGTQADFDRAVGALEAMPAPPAYEALLPLLKQNSHLARWDTELDRRGVALALEEAGAIPDVEFSIGVKHLNETDDQAAVVGLAMPLPFFDRNQGNIAAANLAVRRAKEELRAKQAELTTALQAAYQELSAAHQEERMLGQQVLPAAESAFEASRKVFEEGKGDYLNVLDAQRTLIGAREQYVAVLAAQIRAATQVEGLIGQPLATLTEADPADQETGHVD